MPKEDAQPKEQPVLETPKEVKVEVQPEDKATELLSKLETLGLDSPEKIQSTYQASAQSGNLANLLGEERKRAQQLEQRLAQLEQAQRQPKQQDYGYYEEPTTQGTSLTVDHVKAAAREVLGEYMQNQRQAQMATAQEFSRIQSDQDFPAVRPIWEKHLSNPNVQFALQSGQTTLADQYNTVVRGYYKGLLMQSRDTIQGYVGKTRTAPPHMEQQNNAAPPRENPPAQQGPAAVREIMGKSAGGDEDINNALKALFPDTDPMFRT